MLPMSEAGPEEVVEQTSGEGPALQRPDATIEQAYRERVALFTNFLRHGGSVPFDRWLRFTKEDMTALTEAAAVVQGERAGMLAEAIVEALAVVSEQRRSDDPLETAGLRALAEAGGPPA